MSEKQNENTERGEPAVPHHRLVRWSHVEVSVTEALSHAEYGPVGTNPAFDFGCMVSLASEVKRLRQELMDAYKPESCGDHDL